MSSPIPGFVVLALLIAVAAFAAYAYRERQRRRVRAVADAAGLAVDTTTKPPPPIPFDLFDEGRIRQITTQMWRPGEQDSVFQYRYSTGSGDSSTTERFTGALVEVPFRAPHLRISTENWWSRAKRVVGVRDIEVESPTFNERYHVSGDDERFAIALLDPPMIAWMLSPFAGGGEIRFEFLDRWLLCYRDQLDPEALPAMLTWAQSVRHQLPSVLTELYGA